MGNHRDLLEDREGRGWKSISGVSSGYHTSLLLSRASPAFHIMLCPWLQLSLHVEPFIEMLGTAIAWLAKGRVLIHFSSVIAYLLKAWSSDMQFPA